MGFFTADANFDPVAHWPGTQWQKVEGRFILAASAAHPLGETGGAESVALTAEQNGPHEHTFLRPQWFRNDGTEHTTSIYGITSGTVKIHEGETETAGEGKPHNNMPPYVTRIYWERVG